MYSEILKRNNLNSLKIIDIIDNHLKNQKKIPDSQNLIKIFYMELVIYASNFNIIKYSPFKHNSPVQFPYLNSDYINNQKKIKFKRLKNKNRLIDSLKIGINKNIFISRNISLNKKKLVMLNIMNKVQFLSEINLTLLEMDNQIIDLNILLKKIMNFFKLKNANFSSNFVNYVKVNLSDGNNLTNFRPKNSTLIVGTNMNISNRLLSAKFLQEKTNKVISINHSCYPFYLYNEPIRNVEYSLCTDYISYGNYNFSKKIKKTFFSIPKFHFTSFKNIKGNFKIKTIKKLNMRENFKYLYVPNMFNKNIRYGPYRDMDDEIYYKFQKELLNTFRNANIKNHPKGQINHFRENEKHTKLNFDKILNLYDVYIFDYFATAFSEAIATDKPIIYFDLGLRNLEKSLLDIIKKRVYYYKINLDESFEQQLKKFLLNFDDHQINKQNFFTQKYSLNNKNKDIYELLNNIS